VFPAGMDEGKDSGFNFFMGWIYQKMGRIVKD